MPQFRVTRVYIVDAVNRLEARAMVDTWLASGLDSYPVRLAYEGLRPELEDTGGWIQEFRNQLLGPRGSGQHPDRKQSRS